MSDQVLRSSTRGGVGWSGRATARDVAAVAGVSAQTVSRVANGTQSVAEPTRQKVLAAMAQLGYAPNAAAQALRAGRSSSIGVVAHHLNRTGEANIIDAVCTSARQHGYDVALAHAASGSAEDVNRAIARARQGVAGLVVLGLETAELATVRIPPSLPVVLADSRTDLSVPNVGLDQQAGARLAVDHLLGLGHDTVHLVAGPRNSMQSRQREQGWRESLQAAGRRVPATVSHGDWSPASGYRAGFLVADDPSITAVLVANDEMAAGLLRALHERGRRVPRDVAVVGFDDVSAAWLWPPLTSVQQDFTTIGFHLVDVLLRQIDRRDHGGPVRESILVPPHLQVRASSGIPSTAEGEHHH
ncbi:LacI family DNA-binding transcriptional regulator [Acidipropionibacterium jensenii]|uniref:LacI family DNA-binding transcriptional regulator n=1 Tax=Acidipropionibacterium jensenii TaxID=1749 RepID=UPI002647A662|nr:LacI family DNA-binding transcriptional regulator [Acidipropionibacterium jensenii]MDN6762927.1 LacI family DNA-binding transcriptional regulator [Acidipropionibacterium jensenii]